MDVNFYLTNPIASIGDFQRGHAFSGKKFKRIVVLKSKRRLLEDLDVVLAGSWGALLSSFVSPCILLDMLSSMHGSSDE